MPTERLPDYGAGKAVASPPLTSGPQAAALRRTARARDERLPQKLAMPQLLRRKKTAGTFGSSPLRHLVQRFLVVAFSRGVVAVQVVCSADISESCASRSGFTAPD